MTEQEKNKQLCRDVFFALENNDTGVFERMLTKDCVVELVGDIMNERTMKTGADMIEANKNVGGADLKWLYNIYEMCAEGDTVMFSAESLNRRPNGKLYNCRYTFTFKFRDGKIYYWREQGDTQMITWGLYDGMQPWPPYTDEERIKAFYERGSKFPQERDKVRE